MVPMLSSIVVYLDVWTAKFASKLLNNDIIESSFFPLSSLD
jgi:hypothetical protein